MHVFLPRIAIATDFLVSPHIFDSLFEFGKTRPVLKFLGVAGLFIVDKHTLVDAPYLFRGKRTINRKDLAHE